MSLNTRDLLNCFLGKNFVTIFWSHAKDVLLPYLSAKLPSQSKVYVVILRCDASVKRLSLEIQHRTIITILKKLLTNSHQLVNLSIIATIKHYQGQIHNQQLFWFFIDLIFVILEVLNKKVNWLLYLLLGYDVFYFIARFPMPDFTLSQFRMYVF